MKVRLFTPQRRQCGVSDYSAQLLPELQGLAGLKSVETVSPPELPIYAGPAKELTRYLPLERQFAALGSVMNHMDDGSPADVAHIQHQYFLFGGVSPLRNHAAAFLNHIQIPVVLTVHELVKVMPEASWLRRTAIGRTNCQNLLHPSIRRWIVHTGADREALINLGAPVERIVRISHGIPASQRLPDIQEARQYLALEGRFVLTMFGFLAEKKGHFVALEALRLLSPETILMLAGGQHPEDRTDYTRRLQLQIAKLGLSERVRISGYLSETETAMVMSATDIALAPFLQTSGSGSLARLISDGRAIIASDIEPHREIASESPSCLLLFENGNPAELAKQITALQNSPARMAELSSAARQYARRHSYGMMARETLQVYQDALNDAA